MRLIIEEIEGINYLDIILSEDELHKMKFGEMITGQSYFNGKRLYIGIYEIKVLVYEREKENLEENSQIDETS